MGTLDAGASESREESVDRIAELTAIEDIKRLKARYFRTLDTKDWAGFREVFTEGFVSDTSAAGGRRVEGREPFLAFLGEMVGARRTVHQGHMPEIVLTSPTTAEGIWALEDWVRFAPGLHLHGYGHYHETYERRDGRWRIKTSTLTRVWQDVVTPVFTLHLSERMERWMVRAGARLAARAEATSTSR